MPHLVGRGGDVIDHAISVEFRGHPGGEVAPSVGRDNDPIAIHAEDGVQAEGKRELLLEGQPDVFHEAVDRHVGLPLAVVIAR